MMEREYSDTEILGIVMESVDIVEKNIKNKRYTCLRQYRDMKENNRSIIGECLDWINAYSRLFTRMMENKRVLKLA